MHHRKSYWLEGRWEIH